MLTNFEVLPCPNKSVTGGGGSRYRVTAECCVFYQAVNIPLLLCLAIQTLGLLMCIQCSGPLFKIIIFKYLLQ